MVEEKEPQDPQSCAATFHCPIACRLKGSESPDHPALPKVVKLWVRSAAWGLSRAGKYLSTKTFLPLHHFFLSLPHFRAGWVGAALCAVAGKGLSVKHHITSLWAHFALAQAAKGSS